MQAALGLIRRAGAMQNYRMILAYDGTAFHGWQRQPGVRTVQDEVEQTLMRVLRCPVVVDGASRTDAGVHAAGQTASFQCDATIPLVGMTRAIAHRLPSDISLVALDRAPPGFHASRAALAKLYRYRIHNALRSPVESQQLQTAWHVWHALDLASMRSAAAKMVGTHDYQGFASAGSPRATTVRRVRHVCIRALMNEVLIDVCGDGFLYNQVRNMVGTLYEIGRGHWQPERVDQIIASRDRRLAGPTAPAKGLCLQWIRYAPLRSTVHET